MTLFAQKLQLSICCEKFAAGADASFREGMKERDGDANVCVVSVRRGAAGLVFNEERQEDD